MNGVTRRTFLGTGAAGSAALLTGGLTSLFDPSIAAAAATGRADTRRTLQEFWHRIHDDGLLPPSIDLEWLTETATLVAHAETYLLIGKTTGWDRDTYRDWLATTWRRLAASST